MVSELDMTSSVEPVRLYLWGFMGAGKSTVGEVLAGRLGWRFDDLDDVIEREEDRTIPEIFREDGEETFRSLETKYLRELSDRSAPYVLAVGGGAPIQPENRSLMEETGLSVFLHVPFSVAYRRIQQDDHRPLVPDGPEAEQQLRQLWNAREEIYRSADRTIECGERNPGEIADLIETQLKNR